MGFFNEYPYTNLHEVNLDYVIKKIQEFENITNNILDKKIDSYIAEMFNKIMIDAIYVKDTETIVLKKEAIAGEGIHVYDPNNNTMKID